MKAISERKAKVIEKIKIMVDARTAANLKTKAWYAEHMRILKYAKQQGAKKFFDSYAYTH